MMVLARCVGLVNLANMIPVIPAYSYQDYTRDLSLSLTVINTPMMLWRLITNTAVGHSVEIILPPYPMVCWVSTLNRKAEVKSTTFSTHTRWEMESSGSRSPDHHHHHRQACLDSPWSSAMRYQMTAKRNQETK